MKKPAPIFNLEKKSFDPFVDQKTPSTPKGDWEPIAIERITRKDGICLPFPFLGTAGATAANYDQVYTVPRGMRVMEVSVCFSTASASGTLQIEKLTGTQAPGAGSTILTSSISLSGSANNVVTVNKTGLNNAATFEAGDRIAFIDGGTLTGLTGLHISLYCKPVGKGDYR